jgi:hypothetical protein
MDIKKNKFSYAGDDIDNYQCRLHCDDIDYYQCHHIKKSMSALSRIFSLKKLYTFPQLVVTGDQSISNFVWRAFIKESSHLLSKKR